MQWMDIQVSSRRPGLCAQTTRGEPTPWALDRRLRRSHSRRSVGHIETAAAAREKAAIRFDSDNRPCSSSGDRRVYILVYTERLIVCMLRVHAILGVDSSYVYTVRCCRIFFCTEYLPVSPTCRVKFMAGVKVHRGEISS